MTMWLRKTCGDERHPILDQDKRYFLDSYHRAVPVAIFKNNIEQEDFMIHLRLLMKNLSDAEKEELNHLQDNTIKDKKCGLWSFDRFKEWVKRKDGHAF